MKISSAVDYLTDWLGGQCTELENVIERLIVMVTDDIIQKRSACFYKN